MKMEPTVSSETSAIRTQTPGNYPKKNKLRFSCSWHFSVFAEIGLQIDVSKDHRGSKYKTTVFFGGGGGNRVVMMRSVKDFIL